MAVITWRSLAPTADAATGANLLAAAQRSGNLAFDPFKKILADQEAFAASQAAGVREGNKQAFLTALQGAKTPEEVAALQASGQLQELQSRLTPQDLAAVRGADEARVAGLRQQITTGQQFDDGQLLRSQRTLEGDILSDISAGKLIQARAALAESPDLVNRAKLLALVTDAEKANEERNWTKTQREWTTQNNNRQQQIGDLTLKATKQQADDAAQTRALDTRVAQYMADFYRNAGPGSGGETQAKANFIQQLQKEGVSPAQIARVDSILTNGLSTAPTAPIGLEAANTALTAAMQQVGFDQQDAGNSWYSPGSQDARNTYDTLAKEIPEIIKGMKGGFSNGFNPEEDIPALQRMLGKIATEGIKIKVDGQEQTVVPSANDVRRFLRSSEGGWFFDSARADDVETKLKAWLNSSEGMTMVKRGLESQAFRNAQKVKQLQREYLNPQRK